jgi:hypothetical protein
LEWSLGFEVFLLCLDITQLYPQHEDSCKRSHDHHYEARRGSDRSTECWSVRPPTRQSPVTRLATHRFYSHHSDHQIEQQIPSIISTRFFTHMPCASWNHTDSCISTSPQLNILDHGYFFSLGGPSHSYSGTRQHLATSPQRLWYFRSS